MLPISFRMILLATMVVSASGFTSQCLCSNDNHKTIIDLNQSYDSDSEGEDSQDDNANNNQVAIIVPQRQEIKTFDEAVDYIKKQYMGPAERDKSDNWKSAAMRYIIINGMQPDINLFSFVAAIYDDAPLTKFIENKQDAFTPIRNLGLFWVCTKGSLDILQRFIVDNIIQIKSDLLKTILWASYNKNYGNVIIQWLTDAKKSPLSGEDILQGIKYVDKQGFNALMVCASKQPVEVSRVLLENGASVLSENKKTGGCAAQFVFDNPDGARVLQLFCEYDSQCLMFNGSNGKIPSVFYRALKEKNSKILWSVYCHLSDNEKDDPYLCSNEFIFQIIKSEDIAKQVNLCIIELLQRGKNFSPTKTYGTLGGMSLLHLASQKQWQSVIDAVLRVSKDGLGTCSDKGKTAIEYILENNDYANFKLLVESDTAILINEACEKITKQMAQKDPKFINIALKEFRSHFLNRNKNCSENYDARVLRFCQLLLQNGMNKKTLKSCIEGCMCEGKKEKFLLRLLNGLHLQAIKRGREEDEVQDAFCKRGRLNCVTLDELQSIISSQTCETVTSGGQKLIEKLTAIYGFKLIAWLASNKNHGHEILKFLMTDGGLNQKLRAAVNRIYKFESSHTALMTCALKGSMKMMQTLFDYEANAEVKNERGETALSVALNRHDEGDAGAIIHLLYKKFPAALAYPIRDGQENTLLQLIEQNKLSSTVNPVVVKALKECADDYRAKHR